MNGGCAQRLRASADWRKLLTPSVAPVVVQLDDAEGRGRLDVRELLAQLAAELLACHGGLGGCAGGFLRARSLDLVRGHTGAMTVVDDAARNGARVAVAER